MKPEELQKYVGTMVMSRDPGTKLTPSVLVPHGPYLLIKITKAGFALLKKGKDEVPIKTSLISLPTEDK